MNTITGCWSCELDGRPDLPEHSRSNKNSSHCRIPREPQLMVRKVTKYKQRTKAQTAVTKTEDFLSLIYFLLPIKRLPATLRSDIISSHIQPPPNRHTHFGAYQRQQMTGGERKFFWHEPPDDGVSSRFVKEKIEHCYYYCRYSSQCDHK